MAVFLCGREHPAPIKAAIYWVRAAQHDTVIHLNRQPCDQVALHVDLRLRLKSHRASWPVFAASHVYMAMAHNEAQLLKLKPQNLLLNLPLAA